MEQHQLELLWHAVQSHLKGDVEGVYKEISGMYEYGLELSADVDALFIDYLVNPKLSLLIDFELLAVRKYIFDDERHVFLVSWLVVNGWLSLGEAVGLIPMASDQYNKLPESIRNVIDVTWLLTQDSKEGLLDSLDDSLLIDALRGVVNNSTSQ